MISKVKVCMSLNVLISERLNCTSTQLNFLNDIPPTVACNCPPMGV